ncbi:MHD domain-containing protein [Plasmodiophora brassicae]|uniref:MHD domain-containing protein n=1 Tax=Plasmodiophora brassicae TaxID=37360 RepID=A0A0G4J419_PLABS|nr:hypothetical protein PBRA_008894 [Plasmodiophora brassicae]SPQ93758.1 unnamed protein product [Plasmodiophora brassicae]
MISAVLFVNTKGDVIISRYFRDDVTKLDADAFRLRVIAAKEASVPIIRIDDCSSMYIRHGDLHVVTMSKSNCHPALCFEYMFKLVEVFKAYFGGSFDEDAIRSNFVLVYELLDETMDYGFPQILSALSLKQYIKAATVKDLASDKGAEPVDNNKITSEITGAIDWRQPGKYKYKKNEVYIDILESVNLLMSSDGTVLRSDVSGKIMLKAYLTGMPECKFGMNDKLVLDKDPAKAAPSSNKKGGAGIAIDDCTFHRCVRLGRFDTDRTISFVPPDGDFQLMSYRITQNVNLPFTIKSVITEHGKSRVTYRITLSGNFDKKLFATNVLMKIPVPKNTSTQTMHAGNGATKYDPASNAIQWKIRKFAGDASYSLNGEVHLKALLVDKPWQRPPIALEFQVSMFTASGLQVRFLKVVEKKNSYPTVKWVRYITKNGQYQIRI